MIEAKATLNQPLRARRQFSIRTGGGHYLLTDDKDGASGPKPIELIAAGLAGCTAFDVIAILRKKRQKITGYEVRVEADQVQHAPMVFEKVRIHHVITGVDVQRYAVEDAIRLSDEKYCAAGAMIRKSAEVTTTYEIVQETSPVVEPELAATV